MRLLSCGPPETSIFFIRCYTCQSLYSDEKPYIPVEKTCKVKGCAVKYLYDCQICQKKTEMVPIKMIPSDFFNIGDVLQKFRKTSEETEKIKAETIKKIKEEGEIEKEYYNHLISQLDFRVGKIVKIEKINGYPNNNILRVDLGEDTGPRTIVSVIKNTNEILNRSVIVCANRKPSYSRWSIKSYGDLMWNEKYEIYLLDLPKGAGIGQKISVGGEEGIPLKFIDPRKRFWSKHYLEISSKIHVNTSGNLCFQNIPFTISIDGLNKPITCIDNANSS